MKYSHPVMGAALALGLVSACNSSEEKQNVGHPPENQAAVEKPSEPAALPVKEDFEQSARDEIDADTLEAKVAELEAEAAPQPDSAGGAK